jgi:hypothetical protein
MCFHKRDRACKSLLRGHLLSWGFCVVLRAQAVTLQQCTTWAQQQAAAAAQAMLQLEQAAVGSLTGRCCAR